MSELDSKITDFESFPTQAQVVIVGGGVIGCSVAYHLTKLGWTDVVLLERTQLTAGTTWHAAGLVEAGGFHTETILEMAKYTRELYRNLEEETGQSTGFKDVGYLEIAMQFDLVAVDHVDRGRESALGSRRRGRGHDDRLEGFSRRWFGHRSRGERERAGDRQQKELSH